MLSFLAVVTEDHEGRWWWVASEAENASDVVAQVQGINHLPGSQMDVWTIVAKSNLPSIGTHLKNLFDSQKNVVWHRC
jgi:hypothetical protein